ncbi:hypothetical protein IV203_008613 [Nitzschia inconspicua]|uniref:Uncharacterized protein n=1 Tax=Nitzschia inconspicua TaxID=303405 RepID=A0A9K3KYU4_9STRA|nr:hypothetical protein IV203_008613 [Nitzschia inconspicua]
MWFQGSAKPERAEEKRAATAENGTDDRYAVDRTASVTEESALDTSIVSSDNSSYVSTGTSFETDDSAIDPDDLFDDDELDELMDLESNPIMGGWVDSACGWLDKPMCFMPFGKETSLLRQSKGRTKSALQQMRMNEALSTVANMKLSAAERRNLRLSRKGLSTVQETDDVLSTNSSQFISPEKIQPLKREAETKVKRPKKKTDGQEKKQASSSSTDSRKKDENKKQDRPKIEKETTSVVSKETSSGNEANPRMEKNERSQRMERSLTRDPEGSHHSRMIDLDGGSTDELAKPEEELDDVELSQTLENALMDTPDPNKPIHDPDDEKMNIPELELPESDSIRSGFEKGNNGSASDNDAGKEESRNDSIHSQRSGVRSTRKNKIMKNKIMEVMQRSQCVPRDRDVTDLTHVDSGNAPDDEQKSRANPISIPKPIEIIDVLSMDDNDSWTPGATSVDPEPSSSKRQFEYYGMQRRAGSKSRDPSPSISRRSLSRYQRDPSPSQSGRKPLNGILNAEDLWNEEEAKLTNRKSSNEVSKHRVISLSSAQTADDVWTEEEQKLQEAESIFDDPKAREAFLGHRRGRLQDTGLQNRSSSHSRRRLLVQALQEGEEDIYGDNSKRSFRSRSGDPRKAPAPEAERQLQRSRSKSRDSRRTSPVVPTDQQDEILDQRTSQSHVHKSKDLVVIRTIEDGQRLRSNRAPNNEDAINVHEYLEGSVSRGGIGRSSPMRRSLSRHRRSKNREIVDLAHVDDFEGRRSVSRSRDARDDHESTPESRTKGGSPKSPKSISSDWPDYETVASATKELRKLERKIEKQLRQVKRDSKTKNDWESQTVSSKEIKKLEKQLAQKLKRDNEKRATKLQRIKHKVPKSNTTPSASDDPQKSHKSIRHFPGRNSRHKPCLDRPIQELSPTGR